MATFTFRAVDENAAILTGKLQASNESELEQKLSLQGLTLIEASKAGILDFTTDNIRFDQQELANFTYFLNMIVASGLPITTGLNDLMENRENGKIAHVAGLIYRKIEAGMSLSEAMQEYPRTFPSYYVQMVAAGEASSKLEVMLIDLMKYLEWQMSFNQTVRSAVVYPATVLGAVFLLITALFTFVFPRLVGILTGLHAELPLPTKILIAVANFANHYFFVILLFTIIGIVAFKMWLRTYAGRRAFDGFLLFLPLVGPLIRKINLSRYCRTLATLHAAGLNVDKTFTISSSVVRNSVLAEGLAVVTESVINGEGIAPSMLKSGIFPSLVIEMVAIGEKTGNLDVAVQRVSEMFDKEVPKTLKKMFAYLEPAILTFLGVLVLGVLLSVFLPIYKIAGGIRAR